MHLISLATVVCTLHLGNSGTKTRKNRIWDSLGESHDNHNNNCNTSLNRPTMYIERESITTFCVFWPEIWAQAPTQNEERKEGGGGRDVTGISSSYKCVSLSIILYLPSTWAWRIRILFLLLATVHNSVWVHVSFNSFETQLCQEKMEETLMKLTKSIRKSSAIDCQSLNFATVST